MNRLAVIGMSVMMTTGLFSQARKQPIKGILVPAVIVNNDTLPSVRLAEVKIYKTRVFKNKRQAARYDKLRRDVKRVYPYAILASAKLREYNATLSRIHNEIQRDAYMKKAEKELRTQFESDLRKLTFSQGRILIKLIDRETGKTSYQIVKELRGSFSAFMWQSLACLFGSNLKSEYDAKGDDKMIEDIIYLIESGEI
jgi:hypothetical protein